MIVELDPKYRNERDVLSDEKQEIRKIGYAKVDKELIPFNERIEVLYKKDTEFRTKAKEVIKTIKPGTFIRVRTTGGPQSSIVYEHKGKFVKSYTGGDLFNMFTVERGEFTIGLSCCCYLEILN